jgi:4-amino-4-deoxy-L-arabinose transferase-like glycosyltransferase
MGRRAVLPLLFSYLAIHFVLRLLLSSSLEQDEAEQVLFGQSFAWGYSGQPPLYTWLFRSLSLLLGVNILTLTLLKTMLLAATYLFLYRIARRTLGDDERSFLATFSLLVVPLFAVDVFGDFTHSVLLCAVCAATYDAVTRLLDDGGTRRYALLGLLVGLGILSKYNYLLFLAACGFACQAVPQYRARLWDRRMAITVLVAAIIVLPHAFWIGAHWTDLVSIYEARLGGAVGLSPAGRLVAGSTNLVSSLLLLVGPLGLLLAAFFPAGLRRSPTERSAAPDERRLLKSLLLAALGLLVVQAVCGCAVQLTARWLMPFALFLPIYYFARLDRAALSHKRVLNFALLLLLAACCAVGWRGGKAALEGYRGAAYRERDRIFAQYADQLKEAGLHRLTIIALDHTTGGNLRFRLPETNVLCVECPDWTMAAVREPGPYLVVGRAKSCDRFLPRAELHVGRRLPSSLVRVKLHDPEPPQLDCRWGHLGFALADPRQRENHAPPVLLLSSAGSARADAGLARARFVSRAR